MFKTGFENSDVCKICDLESTGWNTAHLNQPLLHTEAGDWCRSAHGAEVHMVPTQNTGNPAQNLTQGA